MGSDSSKGLGEACSGVSMRSGAGYGEWVQMDNRDGSAR